MSFRKQAYLRILSLLAIILITGTVFAKSSLPQLNDKASMSLSQSFPQLQQYIIEQFETGGKSTQFKYKAQVDTKSGGIGIEATSKDIEIITQTNSSFQITNSLVVIKNKDMIKKYSLDKVENVYNCEKQVVIVREYLNEQIKKTKEHKYSLELHQLPSFDIMELFLQSMLLKGVTEFNSDIVMDGDKYNVDFHLEKMKSLTDLKAKYKYPEKFTEIFRKFDQFYVYSAEATGAVKLFFPYKFYYAYELNHPYSLIATWGGNPKECVYKTFSRLE